MYDTDVSRKVVWQGRTKQTVRLSRSMCAARLHNKILITFGNSSAHARPLTSHALTVIQSIPTGAGQPMGAAAILLQSDGQLVCQCSLNPPIDVLRRRVMSTTSLHSLLVTCTLPLHCLLHLFLTLRLITAGWRQLGSSCCLGLTLSWR
jgi:hypothetical protein